LNGGQIQVGNGYDASFQGAILLGTVTVGGTNSSTITTNIAGSSAVDGVMLGAMGTDAAGNLPSLIQFTVNSTGSSGPDLTVAASLVDPAYSPNVGGAVAGDGGINLQGTGTMLLTAINPYSGPTFVTSGKLVVSSIQGATGMTNYVAVNDGAALGVVVSGTSQWSPVTLSLGAGSANTLEFTGLNSTTVAPLNPGDLSIDGTTTINIVSAASVVGTYPLVNNWDTSGSLTLGTLPANVLAAHLDTSTSTIKLVITSVSGPSLTPPKMTNSFSAGNLTLTWPTDHIGYRLQVQTNSLNVGLGTNWSTWAGSTATNQEIIPVNPANGSVFFRLVYP
jgi:autotransporter-associated beta strand protein